MKRNRKKSNKKNQLVEITRSFTFKLNLGNYQSADFFCSQKAECKSSEAEKVSEALYEFCKNEVVKSVSKYLRGVEEEKKWKERYPDFYHEAEQEVGLELQEEEDLKEKEIQEKAQAKIQEKAQEKVQERA